ncbi:MAG: FMN-binding negative transcriptional regulator [Pseudomonadota bacterium]
MHPSSVFHTGEQVARMIVDQNPLATLAANGDQGPVIALVPVAWNEDGTTLIGHVARANAFWQTLKNMSPIISAVFRAEQAYVSASAYPSKAKHGRVVPTWNYIAAEARGQLTFRSDAESIRESVSQLSAKMEADRTNPWTVSDAPTRYIDQLLNAIVAFEIDISSIRGVRKLSQNKSHVDRAGVLKELAQRPENAAMAREMEQFR